MHERLGLMLRMGLVEVVAVEVEAEPRHKRHGRLGFKYSWHERQRLPGMIGWRG